MGREAITHGFRNPSHRFTERMKGFIVHSISLSMFAVTYLLRVESLVLRLVFNWNFRPSALLYHLKSRKNTPKLVIAGAKNICHTKYREICCVFQTYLERPVLHIGRNRWIVILSSNEPLRIWKTKAKCLVFNYRIVHHMRATKIFIGESDHEGGHGRLFIAIVPTKDSICRVHCHLVLGGISNQPFGVGESDVAWRGAISLVVRDNFHFVVLKDPNTGVCCTKIDTDSNVGHLACYLRKRNPVKFSRKIFLVLLEGLGARAGFIGAVATLFDWLFLTSDVIFRKKRCSVRFLEISRKFWNISSKQSLFPGYFSPCNTHLELYFSFLACAMQEVYKSQKVQPMTTFPEGSRLKSGRGMMTVVMHYHSY